MSNSIDPITFTPGPWTATEPAHGSENWTVEDGFGTTCQVFGNYEEGCANARLIAAAPDLLEAVRGLLGIVAASYGLHGAEVAQANAALAKATGE